MSSPNFQLLFLFLFYLILDFGFRISDFGLLILDFEFRIPDSRFRIKIVWNSKGQEDKIWRKIEKKKISKIK